jgi:hypothetical protein
MPENDNRSAPSGATLTPADAADYIGKGPQPGESQVDWLSRLREHAAEFAARQANSPEGRRAVRLAIAGQLTRRELLIKSFAAGYEHGVLAGMVAAKTEIAQLEAELAAEGPRS